MRNFLRFGAVRAWIKEGFLPVYAGGSKGYRRRGPGIQGVFGGEPSSEAAGDLLSMDKREVRRERSEKRLPESGEKKLPEPGEEVVVQCRGGFRCLAYLDADGSWKSCSDHENLPDVVKVLEC